MYILQFNSTKGNIISKWPKCSGKFPLVARVKILYMVCLYDYDLDRISNHSTTQRIYIYYSDMLDFILSLFVCVFTAMEDEQSNSFDRQMRWNIRDILLAVISHIKPVTASTHNNFQEFCFFFSIFLFDVHTAHESSISFHRPCDKLAPL